MKKATGITFLSLFILGGLKIYSRWIYLFVIILFPFLVSWSDYVHQSMTKIAVERLPPDQLEIIEPYRYNLISTYCLIPDLSRRDTNYLPYIDSFVNSYELKDVEETSGIGQKRRLLHSADRSETNYKIYEHYTTKICKKFKTDDFEEAFKYLGTFLHFIQDTACPSHHRYGGYQRARGEPGEEDWFHSLEFFKRFMPVPEKYQDIRLHGVIDQGGFNEAQLIERIADYEPTLLGDNVDDVISAFKVRHEQMMTETDRMLIPMLQARFNEDEDKFAEYGLNAAEPSVKLAADFIFSILQICAN